MANERLSDAQAGRVIQAYLTMLQRHPSALAAQIVDGFSDLNENAKQLFATPESGLNR